MSLSHYLISQARITVKSPFVPILIFITGLAATLFVTWNMYSKIADKDQARFQSQTERATNLLEASLNTHIALLRAGSAVIAVKPTITKAEFKTFADKLQLRQTYPGIQGIGYSVKIPPNGNQQLTTFMKSQGVTNFSLHPDTPRDEYHAIIYLEPQDDRNQNAIGYDMYSEPIRQKAMQQARDSALPTLSGKVVLVQEIDQQKQAGFLIYVPIYKNGLIPDTVNLRQENLIGFIYSPFRADDLMRSVYTPNLHIDVSYQIFDGTSLDPDHLLSTSPQWNSIKPSFLEPNYYSIQQITIAQHTWTLAFRPDSTFLNTSNYRFVPMIAILGCGVTLLLSSLSLLQYRAQRQRVHILETIDDGFLSIDPNGQLSYINPEGTRMIGKNAREVIGKHIWTVIPSLKRSAFGKWYMQNYKKPSSQVFEEYYAPRKAWYMIRTYASQSMLTLYFTDITERKKTDELLFHSNERFKLMAKATNDIIWDWDLLTDHLWWNNAINVLFGYPRKEITPHISWWKNHLHPEDRDRIDSSITKTINTGQKTWKDEYRFQKHDGSYAYIFDRGYIIHDKYKKPVRMVGSMLDITEQKRAEQRKDEFIGIASHELKTPLTTVKGYLQLLDRKIEKLGDKTMEAYVKKTNNHLDKLNTLISDLLDVSKIQAGKLQMNFTQFNFEEIVDDAIQSVQLTTTSHIILKQGRFDHLITGDKYRLEQVILNLLTNAIKYSPGEKQVLISVTKYKHKLKLSVTDFGVGIPRAEQSNLFQRFYRVQTTSDRFSGLGIGLYISDQIIRRHQGLMEVKSAKNKGSTFSFTIPVQPKATSQSAGSHTNQSLIN